MIPGRRTSEDLTGAIHTTPAATTGPEDEALLADSVGLALHPRPPGGRHEEASRARQKVRGTPPPRQDLARQRSVVTAFLAAARSGELDALLEVLAPDVVRRAGGTESRGARRIAEETAGNAAHARFAAAALVNGRVGAVVAPHGRLALDIAPRGSPGRALTREAAAY